MTLAEWMDANGVNDDDLAEMLQVDRSTASRYRRGKLIPSAGLLEKIIKITAGRVQPNSFFGLPAANGAAA